MNLPSDVACTQNVSPSFTEYDVSDVNPLPLYFPFDGVGRGIGWFRGIAICLQEELSSHILHLLGASSTIKS